MRPPPPMIPHYHVALQNEDDFIRDLATVAIPGYPPPVSAAHIGVETALSPAAGDREPVLTLDQIKLHCRIEPDQTDEDALLTGYERAAMIHTEVYLRRPGQLSPAAPENVKQAMLVLIAHWYRNRESVSDAGLAEVPLAYAALLSGEREYGADY